MNNARDKNNKPDDKSIECRDKNAARQDIFEQFHIGMELIPMNKIKQ